jgi:hypothetical protein
MNVSQMLDFFADQASAGRGNWKVYLDPRGLLPLTKRMKLNVSEVDYCDSKKEIVFLNARIKGDAHGQ